MTAGFHSASKRFRTVRAVELDPAASLSFSLTFGEGIVHQGTVESWLQTGDRPDVDVIIGGPPCQGFSTLGKQDAEDSRNSLWLDYAQTIRKVGPKYFVVENVAAFAKSAQFRDFQDAVKPRGMLRDFDFDFRVLNSADYGAPQSRKRAVLIGHHRDLPAPGFPDPTHATHVSVRTALSGVPVDPDRVFDESRKLNVGRVAFAGAFSIRDLHVARSYSDLSLKRFASIPSGGNRFDLPETLKANCWRNHTTGSADVMGRLHWDRPSVTIRTEFFKPEKGRYLHPEAMRAITHYEAALLQGFDSKHRFAGSRTSIARQIGNAVPIPLGSAIAKHLEKSL